MFFVNKSDQKSETTIERDVIKTEIVLLIHDRVMDDTLSLETVQTLAKLAKQIHDL